MRMHGPMNIKFTRYSCQILRKLEFSRKVFEIYSNIKFKENISSEGRVTSCRRTDVAKLTIDFAILRTRHKRAVLRRNPLQVLESFSFTRELLCCFYFWKENTSLSKEKKKRKPFPLWRLILIVQVNRTRRSANLSTVSLNVATWCYVLWHSQIFLYTARVSWMLCHNVTLSLLLSSRMLNTESLWINSD